MKCGLLYVVCVIFGTSVLFNVFVLRKIVCFVSFHGRFGTEGEV